MNQKEAHKFIKWVRSLSNHRLGCLNAIVQFEINSRLIRTHHPPNPPETGGLKDCDETQNGQRAAPNTL